jgi:hypothetical protein
MAERGSSAKKRGAKSAATTGGRKTRSVAVTPDARRRGAARTVRDGRLYELIYAEWLSGRDPRSLAAEHPVELRRVYEIIKECREGMVAELAFGEPGRARVLVEEVLLQKYRAVSDAREIELRAREKANTSVELGAYNSRTRALRDLTMFLRESGLFEEEPERPAVSQAQLVDEINFARRRWKEMADLGRDQDRKHWERRTAALKTQYDTEYPRTYDEHMSESAQYQASKEREEDEPDVYQQQL